MHADHGQSNNTNSEREWCRAPLQPCSFHSFPLPFPPRIAVCQTLRSRVLQAAAAGAVPTNKSAPQPIASSHAPIRALTLSQAHA